MIRHRRSKRDRPLVAVRGRRLCWLSAVLLFTASCDGRHREPHPDWVIRSKVAFLAADLGSARQPLPLSQFRLVFPYIAGDIYGAPTTGDFFDVRLGADYSFEIDLNRNQQALLASLEPTEFSVSYLRIEPASARVARLAPIALQADGIEQVGRTDWVDSDAKRPLLLLYVDRPAKITGQTVSADRPVRYAIQADSAGYVWVAEVPDAQGTLYTVVPTPARLSLAIRPPVSGLPKAASPTRKDIPAQ